MTTEAEKALAKIVAGLESTNNCRLVHYRRHPPPHSRWLHRPQGGTGSASRSRPSLGQITPARH